MVKVIRIDPNAVQLRMRHIRRAGNASLWAADLPSINQLHMPTHMPQDLFSPLLWPLEHLRQKFESFRRSRAGCEGRLRANLDRRSRAGR